jgi:hypothetical protein
MTLSRLLPSVLLLISSAAQAGRLNDGVAGVAWGARETFPAPMEGCAHKPEPDAEWICQKKMGEASVRIGYTWKYGLVYGSVLEARSFLDCDTLRRVLKEAWGDGRAKSDYAKGPMDDWFWFDGPVAAVWSYNQFSKICSVTVIHRPSMELVQLKDQEAARSISNGI